VKKIGEFKKVVRIMTGEAFRVPTRDILENGLREQDLDKYPKWEETNERPKDPAYHCA
jgi:hypothetical protein